MSEFSLKRQISLGKHASRGFTLLEILVVLTIVGLMTAFSLPQISVMQDRLKFTLNRDSFERELSGLSYAAFKEGRPLILSGEFPRPISYNQSRTTFDPQSLPSEPLFLQPGELRPARPVTAIDAALVLPENWRLSVDKPIVYQASGFCEGGTVKLAIGEQAYTYALRSPTCKAELQ
jgi:prepilin-type N-terminal cleavage/methylation domain-containing protein